ncbi:MAG: hypothetical protein MK161_12580, partial [Pirellulales bacterium]|nr:hypothetical protein [Pirellulales bacterium]
MAALALVVLSLVLCGGLRSVQSQNIDVNNTANLVNAINQVNNGTANQITFTGNITLSQELPSIIGQVDIVGGDFRLDGASQFPGLLINAVGHTITIDSLQFRNLVAEGGQGGEGVSAGG